MPDCLCLLHQGMGDAAAAAATYAADMAEMKALLADHGVDLPRARFDGTDAELFRFAATMGLLRARTPAERCARQALELFCSAAIMGLLKHARLRRGAPAESGHVYKAGMGRSLHPISNADSIGWKPV